MPRENIEAVYQAVWQGNYPLSHAPDQTDGLLPPDCPPKVDFEVFSELVHRVPILAEVFISKPKEALESRLDGGITGEKRQQAIDGVVDMQDSVNREIQHAKSEHPCPQVRVPALPSPS